MSPKTNALEELVKLMPAEAHRLRDDGGTEDVPTTALKPEDRVVVRPGEKIPIDGVIVEGRSRGAIALADVIRQESREALATLRSMGIRTMMVTGDAEAVARNVARELEMDEYFAEVLPDKKADKIKEIQSGGMVVAMAGDGINDAPAQARVSGHHASTTSAK